ncbi:MAG: glycosyltransferase family 39 protein [Pedobacter sp.]|nr:glycosyltransferase family 39 protein [Pedobacter sp.]
MITNEFNLFDTRRKLILITTCIALLQFLLHLGAMEFYGFHQDELLYKALSEHLAWGYKETPPFIAIVGAVGKFLFGGSIIGMRIIPALFAGAIVHLTGLITIRLGGKQLAVILSCTAVAFSAAFLATGALFIPQVFDEFFWLLCAYLMICWVQRPNDKIIYLLAAVAGVGLLVKYTILIYLIGLGIGFLSVPKYRQLIKTRTLCIAFGITLAIITPHVLWQYRHGFPALWHYNELKRTQLVYLTRTDFLVQQLVVNGTGIAMWLAGLWAFFRNDKLKPFRFLAIGFIFAMLSLAALNGKPYYAFGAYPALFAAGGIFYERLLKRRKVLFTTSLIAPNLLLAIIVLPFLPIETSSSVFTWTYQNLNLHFPLKWEDQKIHNVNQNYADMIGWEELARKTSELYLSLPLAQRKQTVIFADGYGIAGALEHYRGREYPLPRVVSLSSSFALWAPSTITAQHIIYFSSNKTDRFLFPDKQDVHGVISNPYSGIYGTQICFLRYIGPEMKNWYESQWNEKRAGYGRPIRTSLMGYQLKFKQTMDELF